MMRVYTIFDVKADTFAPPFCAFTDGLAKRMFKDVATDGQSSIAKYPDDFKLVKIGEFDEQLGVMVACTHVSLGFATEFLDKRE